MAGFDPDSIELADVSGWLFGVFTQALGQEPG